MGSGRNRIDLVTVFDTILTSRQTREKLQCLYENLMSNNFHRTAVLKKYEYELFKIFYTFVCKKVPRKIADKDMENLKQASGQN